MAALYLAHAVAALVLVVAAALPRRARGEVTVVVCLLGAAAGLALVFAPDIAWRTTVLDEASALIVGGSIACAWVLAAVLGPAWERWRTGALVGVASTGLALFAANQWVVPALLFWLIAGLATIALSLRPGGQGVAAAWIGVADAAVVAGLVGYAVIESSWSLPAAVTGWPRWVIFAGALARAGAIPRIGIWQTLRSAAAACLPLAAAGAFVVIHRFVGGPLPWAGVGLLAAGVAVLAWNLRSGALAASIVGPWPILLMLAAAVISPAAGGRAGLSACLVITLVALWPSSAGRARVPRGIALAFLPPFVGFGVVLSAAVVAFDRAAAAPTSLRSAPWTGAAAILPLAVAGGTLLALNAALQSRAAPRESAPGLATWFAAAAALVAGFLEPGGFIAPGRVRLLYGVAAAIGLAAFYISVASRHADEIGPIEEGPDATSFDPGLLAFSVRVERTLIWVATGAALAMTTTVVWLTWDGLKNGFLS
jgi:hypothetical protein